MISLADVEFSERLQTVYNCPADELSSHLIRYTRLFDTFHSRYGDHGPVTIVRAPGRVNLIGEHTDYNGYPVLPLTINRDIVFILAPSADKEIELINEDLSFGPRSFTVSPTIMPFEQGDWGNYVKAAVQGLIRDGTVRDACGFYAVVGGTIPGSAGLSSSSALVVASALAFLAANHKSVEPVLLAEQLARAERYVGMEGGGMDQAISLLGDSGKALKIDFFPLRRRSIPLPESISFVVCNSLVKASKSARARDAYNLRVVECRLAAALLSSSISKKLEKPINTRLLADLAPSLLHCTEKELDQEARLALGTQPAPLSEIALRLGENEIEVRRRHCTLKDGSVIAEPPEGFKPWQRYRHVVSEAARVEHAAAALSSGALDELATLMNESHASCRDDYEVSCDELEALVTIAREHGAIGARLTGAGFGGCTVNAVRVGDVNRFLNGVRRDYYETYVKDHREKEFVPSRSIDDAMFVCRPTKRAGIV